MVDHNIVEGLRIALSRGYTLEQAMLSFYNAGYKKEEIEQAARVLAYHPTQPLSHPEKPIPQHIKETKPLPIQKVEELEKEKPEKEKPKVSQYKEKEKPGRLITILLVVFLFILLTSLAGIFIFKDQLISFLANLT